MTLETAAARIHDDGSNNDEALRKRLQKAAQARINGAKSRGPVSPAGKARSSRNGIRHGMSAAIDHTILDGESLEEFEEVSGAFIAQFHPATKPELDLIRKLASLDWRLERLAMMETALLNLGGLPLEEMRKRISRMDGIAQIVGTWLETSTPSNCSALLRRYLVSHERQFQATLSSFRSAKMNRRINQGAACDALGHEAVHCADGELAAVSATAKAPADRNPAPVPLPGLLAPVQTEPRRFNEINHLQPETNARQPNTKVDEGDRIDAPVPLLHHAAPMQTEPSRCNEINHLQPRTNAPEPGSATNCLELTTPSQFCLAPHSEHHDARYFVNQDMRSMSRPLAAVSSGSNLVLLKPYQQPPRHGPVGLYCLGKGATMSVARSLIAAAIAITTSLAAPPVSFNRDIRPIMSDTCFRCHGPDKSSRMANLRLDLRDEATKPLRNGKVPIVPGDPSRSEIVARIFATGPRMMPPEFAHKTLTESQKNTIRRWVAEGAQYEGHWAYQPIRRPDPPNSTGNPIDAFIEARLTREGLRLSPEADRRTLLRRASFDLTGLPPTPAEVAAFQNDKSPYAWKKVVDRLLASPHYAEKQAMHWLDAVRYADSSGFHGDNLLPAWPYRDYILRAFRDNKPFDDFTREQLAGDLIPNATVDQKIASAYNRMNRYSAEGGLQPKEYLAKYGADRVRTLSAAWLGSTIGCAECHDHKFDPFTSKDFYSMKAFFADIKETGLMPDRGETAWGAKLLLATPEQQAQLDALTAKVEEAQRELDDQARTLLAQNPSFMGNQDRSWQWQKPINARSASGAMLTIYDAQEIDSAFYAAGSLKFEHKRGDGLIVASGLISDNDTYTVEFRPGAGVWTALGIDVHQDESLPGARLARGADRFVLSEVEAEIGGRKLPFVLATANKAGEQVDGPALAAIDGDPKTGWSGGIAEARNYMISLRFANKLTTTADTVITLRLRQESPIRRAVIGRFRLALSNAEYSWPEFGDGKKQFDARKENDPNQATLNVDVDHGVPPEVAEALKVAPDQRNERQRKAILNFVEFTRPELEGALVKSEQAALQRTLFYWSLPRVVTTEATEPAITRILPRADWMNETTEIVQPAVPAFLGKLDTGGRRATRLDLANWLVSKDNPLTARAYANRIWREFFGTGISKALDDLGSQGEEPVHAELLDWLASEFMEPRYDAAGSSQIQGSAHNWDMQHLVRTIVMSKAYRQSSMSTPELDEKDPANRLIARQSRFRVDAEVVRDIALQVSGLLVDKFGGPPVKPVAPPGYLLAMNFPKRDYSQSHGEDLYRRGVYTQWQRTFLHPELLNFDAPTREECAVTRVNSNTPLQALDLLNDPIFVEASRVFAQRALSANPRDPIGQAFALAEDRAPTPQERRILDKLYRDSLKQFRADPSAAAALLAIGEAPRPSSLQPANLAALTTVTRAILNLHETITRN